MQRLWQNGCKVRHCQPGTCCLLHTREAAPIGVSISLLLTRTACCRLWVLRLLV
jgi:hypothetical protein